MTGLWARRGKLNLNSPVSAPPSTVEEVVTPAAQPSTTETPNITPQPLVQSDPVETSAAPNGKRKVRSSRNAEGSSNKRTKIASSSGSQPSKDHTPPTARLADLGGVEACVEKMLEFVAMPLLHPEVYIHTGVQPPRGVLLHGPPGCGKTLLANAIAGVSEYLNLLVLLTMLQELGVPFISISAPSIVSGMSGESEKTLRDTFEEAKKASPCLLFIDEIDAITPKREGAQREMERRIVAQFLTCMDGRRPPSLCEHQ